MEVSVSSQMHSHNCNQYSHKLFYSLLFVLSASVWCQSPPCESWSWDYQCRDTGCTIVEVSSPEVVKSSILISFENTPQNVLLIHSKYRISKNFFSKCVLLFAGPKHYWKITGSMRINIITFTVGSDKYKIFVSADKGWSLQLTKSISCSHHFLCHFGLRKIYSVIFIMRPRVRACK